MDTLTEGQKQSLIELQQLMSDPDDLHHGDPDGLCNDVNYLLKWLKASSFNASTAAELFRKSMRWRREVGADTILETYKPPPILLLYYPGGVCGRDKQGRPLWIDPLGRADLKGIMHSVKRSDIIKFIIYRLEVLYAEFRRRSQEEGRVIDQCTHIIDLSSFGPRIFWKPALDLYIEVMQILEKNYPETLSRTYLINAPKMFHFGWKILCKFIDKDTAAKFTFLGSNYAETLLELIDADQLPEYYGGTRTDPDGDGKCQTEICYGGDVPKQHYLSKEDIYSRDVQPVEEKMGRRGTITVGFSIPNCEHVIRYVFSVNHGSINYGIYRQTDTDNIHKAGQVDARGCDVTKLEVVKEMTSLECSRVPEDGVIRFESPGVYYVQFKNTSRVWGKTLTYILEVLTLDQLAGLQHTEGVMVTNHSGDTPL